VGSTIGPKGEGVTTEFDFFGNQHLAKMFDLLIQMAAELHISNQRVRVLQLQLERQGVIKESDIEYFEPDAKELEKLTAAREGMMSRLMAIMTEAGPAEFPLREQWEDRLEKLR
jgi:hypothetical protein